MAQYEIQFKALAAKEFRKLSPDNKSRIRKAINVLKADRVHLNSKNTQL